MRNPARLTSCVALGMALTAPFGALANDLPRPSFVSGGALNICTSGGFPPMEFYAKPGDTTLVGFEVETMTALAEGWGAKPNFIVGDFKAHLPNLAARRCDVVASGISITEERLKSYDGIGYFATAVVMVVAEGAKDLAKPEDLSGKVVAIEAGTNYETIMADLNAKLMAAGKPPAEIQTYPSASAVIEQVLLGRAAATITQDTAAAYRMTQMPGKMKVAYVYPSDDTYGIYLRKDEADRAAVVAGLKSLADSGRLAELLTVYDLPEGSIVVDGKP